MFSLLGSDREFLQFLFEASPSSIVGYAMPFLCFSFAVPSTSRSLLLDDVVCPPFPVCSSSSTWVPFSVARYPGISCTRSNLLPACPFFLSCRGLQFAAHTIFPNSVSSIFGPVHFPFIFMYLLPLSHIMHRYLLVAAHHSVRCFISSIFLSTQIHFLLAVA